MATNKIAIQAKINEIESGVLNPASTVRDVLNDSDNSVLASVYSDSITESTIDTLAITSAGDFDYVFTFRKVGGAIFLAGTFTPLSSLSSGSTIATITNSDWFAEDVSFSANSTTATGELIKISVRNDKITIGSSVFSGEKSTINSLTYNSLN